ncbi:MAG: membrane protein insertion efficiency factor YidD [bacterium]|nr:membrane protein insertion efficiency factor YidD [bacterium]
MRSDNTGPDSVDESAIRADAEEVSEDGGAARDTENRRPRLISRCAVFAIRMYQGISRHTPAVCRFSPTCSEYTRQAIVKYGFLKGTWLGICRICRCHPFTSGGYDPVP